MLRLNVGWSNSRVGVFGSLVRRVGAAAKALWTAPSGLALTQLAGLACGAATFAALTTVAILPYYRQVHTTRASEAEFGAELDQSAPAILQYFHVPGVVISTVVDGAPGKTYAYGYADLDSRRPMTPDTVFRVASISKSLTAWGVLKLVQDGKVALDRPAEDYLDQWPVAPSKFPSRAVTVRRLLEHTSGLSAGEDSFHAADAAAPSTLELLNRQGAGPADNPGRPTLVQPAGAGFIYSVPGYTLLQLMIEQRTGERFDAYMQRAVLQPLGMTSSSFTWDAALQARTATPYGLDGRSMAVDVPDDEAADSLFATAPDIARFVAAPMPDKRLGAGAGVLNPQTVGDIYFDRTKMPSLHMSTVVSDEPGLGYFLEEQSGAPPLITNVGLDPGWSSVFMMAPGSGDGIVVLTNSDSGAPAIAQILSLWSSWRGLPAGNLISGYRTVGMTAAAFLSVLAALDTAYAAGLAFERRRRRFGFAGQGRFVSTALELGLAGAVLSVWAGSFSAVRTMPVLHAVGTVVIIGLVSLAVFRALFPLQDAAPAPKPRQSGLAYAG